MGTIRDLLRSRTAIELTRARVTVEFQRVAITGLELDVVRLRRELEAALRQNAALRAEQATPAWCASCRDYIRCSCPAVPR